MNEDWMTKKEAAQMLGVSTRTLDHWKAAGASLGQIKVGPFGRKTFYKKSAIRRLIRDAPRRRPHDDDSGFGVPV